MEKYWEGNSTSSQENTEFPRSNLNTSYLNNLNVSKCSFCFEEKMSFFIIKDEFSSKNGATFRCFEYFLCNLKD